MPWRVALQLQPTQLAVARDGTAEIVARTISAGAIEVMIEIAKMAVRPVAFGWAVPGQ
jgi:hypothetical protein